MEKKDKYKDENGDLVFKKSELKGTWYQVVHTKMFWEGKEDFNMSATYEMTEKGFSVKNCFVNLNLNSGENEVCMSGEAIHLKQNEFFVSFNGQQKKGSPKSNFRISYLKRDQKGALLWFVVDDPDTGYFSVLHRNKPIPDKEYSEIESLIGPELEMAEKKGRLVIRDRHVMFFPVLGRTVDSKHGHMKKMSSGSHYHSRKINSDLTKNTVYISRPL